MKKEDNNKSNLIDDILYEIPHRPGVYKMRNKDGKIIYVGKAKDLKKRVSSYFNRSNDASVKTEKMVGQIANIDYTVVDSELEALILETNLIKELRPKYNILMKDDKNYVYIKITVNEDYPRILITRKVDKDGAKYYGPKTSQYKVIHLLKVLKKIFPYRHCNLDITYGGKLLLVSDAHPEKKHDVKITHDNTRYPCLDYHIRRCLAPCVGAVSPEEYGKMISPIMDFLEGRHSNLISLIKSEMYKAAQEKKYEIAAGLRDKLESIEDLMEPQKISDPNLKDIDIINYLSESGKLYFNLFQVREGKLINQENFILDSSDEFDESNDDALRAFLEQYYEKATDIASEILIPQELDDKDTIESWIGGFKGRKVKIIVPQRGKRNSLLDLSLENAKSFAKQNEVKWQSGEKESRQKALEKLKTLIGLSKTPMRLECYDVSHLGGTGTVSSMVVFEKGFPRKDQYRKFKLHQEKSGHPDDYASIKETFERRLKYLTGRSGKAINVRLAGPKETAEIKRRYRIRILKDTDYLCIKGVDKEIIGYVRLRKVDTRKIIIENINYDKEIQLDSLIKKIIEKYKISRIYVTVKNKDVPIYEEGGLQVISKIPEGIKKRSDYQIMVFDKNKYAADESLDKAPDLVIVDGGKGQLNVAFDVMNRNGINIPILSLAKKNEEIYMPSNNLPVIIAKDEPLIHLLQHIRDEAHRFAVTYQKKLRKNDLTASKLDDIPGIGEKMKFKILNRFGSYENAYKAPLPDLEKLIGKEIASRIKNDAFNS